jgi:hypothetical protein
VILVDTGPLVAAGDLDARIHDVCVEALAAGQAASARAGPGHR